MIRHPAVHLRARPELFSVERAVTARSSCCFQIRTRSGNRTAVPPKVGRTALAPSVGAVDDLDRDDRQLGLPSDGGPNESGSFGYA